MSANTTPIFPITPRVEAVEIVNADGTTKKSLLTPGSNGTRINKVAACSDDTASVTLKFYYSKDAGSTFLYLGSIAINAGAETNVTTGIKLADAASGLVLPYGTVLYASAGAAVTLGKTVSVSVSGSDY